MKKRIIFFIIAFGFIYNLNAQNYLGKTDDLGRLAIVAASDCPLVGVFICKLLL